VKNKYTGELIPFTLSKLGEVIITGIKEYNLDDLVVSLEDSSLANEVENKYYVFLKENKHD